jgi:hypothetical protein
MPALPVVAYTLKLALSGTIGPYNWANVLHVQYTGGPPDTADLITFATAIATSWNTNIAPLVPSNVILTQVVATDLASTSGASGNFAGSHAGAASGTVGPANAAFLVDYPSSFRYRGGHPRTYLPPTVAGDLQDSAHWTTTIVGTLQTAWRVVLGLLYTSSYSSFSASGQCAVSYVSTAVTPTPPHRRVTPLVMPIAQNTCLIKTEVASQRRRIGRK